jgi:hypothetical protein
VSTRWRRRAGLSVRYYCTIDRSLGGLSFFIEINRGAQGVVWGLPKKELDPVRAFLVLDFVKLFD